MTWRIVLQQEALPFGRGYKTVDVKRIKCFLVENETEVRFGRLPFILLSMILKDERDGTCVTLKCNCSRGAMHPEFSITWPDRTELPRVWVGRGSSRRQVVDRMLPAVTRKGEVERYDIADFRKRLAQFVGPDRVEAILSAFAMRLAILVSKSK